MGSPAGCGFYFRQLHLNMIKESRWLAPLAENTAEMLAWRSVANCTSGTTCAATSSTKGPRRRGFATWQRHALRLQRNYVGTAAHPLANVWRSIPVQPGVKKDL
jgi:hypothetical protein